MSYFKGYYFKHQKGGHTLCVIVGQTSSERFLQIITEKFSRKVPYKSGNIFTKKGIVLDIEEADISLKGRIRYHGLSPIRYDIMGPFRFCPMECRHGVISMRHHLVGGVWLNREWIDFTGGVGYIEMDSGRSFPAAYTWVQANDFAEPCAIMAAVAEIPFGRLRFCGCIGVIRYRGREYRLATYLGARPLVCTRKKVVIKQRAYRLEIRVKTDGEKELCAPENGKMTRYIREAAACHAEFRFYKKRQEIFRLQSRHTGFESENRLSGKKFQ